MQEYDIIIERPDGERRKLFRVEFHSVAEHFCQRHNWIYIDSDGTACQLLYLRAQNL